MDRCKLPGDPGLPPGVSHNDIDRHHDGEEKECRECGGAIDEEGFCLVCDTEYFTDEERADRAEEDAADQRAERY